MQEGIRCTGCGSGESKTNRVGKVKDAAQMCSAVLLAFCLGVVALHLPGWCHGIDHLQSQAQVAVDSVQTDAHGLTTELTKDSATIALDVHRDVVVAGSAEAETEKTMRLLRKEAPSFIAQAHQGLTDVHNLLVDANKQVPLAGDLLRSGRTVLDTANDQLPLAGNLLTSTRQFVDSGNVFLNGPATNMTNSVTGFFVPTGLFMTDVQRKAHTYWYPGKPAHWYGYVGRGATVALPIAEKGAQFYLWAK